MEYFNHGSLHKLYKTVTSRIILFFLATLTLALDAARVLCARSLSSGTNVGTTIYLNDSDAVGVNSMIC